ncbi:calcium-binding and coiled-coil domain-containing protein 2 isoform X1 [Synchiropus splendidus]|uniref:calcium-binding and coiled-coil domain-containing protein 2 isoform X1 n=2 Tax=Synchiropus splendidus TaxID=270530 RepID=UPI00237D76FE|nr:calcium-binding and coiled-coil domain-containing protein 2 isoform X1 [Synchiropus splendidus]
MKMTSLMETPTEDSSPRTLSNAMFVDVPPSYPPSRDITCRYTITSEFQPTTRDWIGIFKVGWSHKSDYCTFVWADMNMERSDGSASRKAVFKEYHLPKDEENAYQFCYMDSAGQVQGVSRPFSFATLDQSIPDSSIEDDVLVVYTKEQINQALQERDELKAQRNEARAEIETLSCSLRRQEEEITILKEQLSQKDAKIIDIGNKLHLLEEENKQLKHTSELEAEFQHLKLKLEEVQEVIAVKDQLIADKDDMILFLQRQNNTRSHKEGLHGARDDFHASPTIPSELQETTSDAASYNKDLPLQETQREHDRDVTEITQESDEEEVLECRYCKERFPGITQQQMDQHELSHKVCPFCWHLCDHMDQITFEDHVYSHN